MPGYFEEVEGGWQRVKGFWVDDAVESVTYYDAPPTSLETGPSSPQPADNYFWIPGNWNYANTDFVWQSGYWAPYQPNWVWSPARWVWTPAGFVFLPGHWDYRLANRGQIFAPVYFTTTVYRPGWYYRPTVVIPTNNVFVHLWIRPGYGSYYFGSYYGDQYAGLGFGPWANVGIYQRQRYIYDPFYSYASVHYHRQGVDFVGRCQGWHNYYHDHPEHRSPRTWREQQQWAASHGTHNTAVLNLTAHHVSDASRRSDTPFKVAKLDNRTHTIHAEHVKKIKDLNTVRRNLEHEHAHVTTRVTGDATRNRDFDKRDRDLDKRDLDKRDLDKVGTDKVGTDKAGSLVDRVEKGKKGGDSQSVRGTPVKLNLPKVDLPASVRNATKTTGGNAAGNVLGEKPPPLPKGDRKTAVTKDNSIAPRSNTLPGKTGSGKTFTQKAGEIGQNTGDIGQKTGANRDRSNDLPGSVLPGKTGTGQTFSQKTGEIGQKKSGENRDGSNDPPGNAGKGKVRSGKTGGTTDGSPGRSNNIPNVQLPGKSGDLPNTNLPGKKNEPPKTGFSGGTGGGNIPRSGNINPGNIEFPGGGQKGGQPTIRNFQPPDNSKSGATGTRGKGGSGGRDDSGGTSGANSSSGGTKGKKKSDDKE
jgi:hypothetical protein